MKTTASRYLASLTTGIILIALLIGSGVLYLDSCQIRFGHLFSDVKVCYVKSVQARGNHCLSRNPQFVQTETLTNTRSMQMTACLESDPPRFPFE